jgi:hypothetical protein
MMLLILTINIFVGASAYLMGEVIGKKRGYLEGTRDGLNYAIKEFEKLKDK